MGRVASQHDYFFTVPPDLGFEESCRVAPRSSMRVYQTKGSFQRWYWETFTLPHLIKAFRPDVVFNLANRGLVSPPCPQATLIRDSHLFYPSSHFGLITRLEQLKFWYHRKHLIRSLRSTSLLFCQTTVAARRIRQVFGDGFAIRLCPKLVSPLIYHNTSDGTVPEPLSSLNGKFKLFVLTRYYPHKNLEVIPRLFERHRADLHDVVVIMTIAPDQHPNVGRLLRDINRHGLENNIISVGSLKEHQLAAYYRHSDALLLPTLLESFSGTYLEAMHFDRPILTSDADFAHEVCSDAAVYFDPRDPDDICAAILRLKNDRDLYARLVNAGQERRAAQPMGWDDVARCVISELEHLVGDGNRARRAGLA
jgi:glycosyltransferase involved in cell wall biosynthesis